MWTRKVRNNVLNEKNNLMTIDDRLLLAFSNFWNLTLDDICINRLAPHA
jgi:hypothetical protein